MKISAGKKTTIFGIILNTLLFIGKITIGLITNSLIVLSDAINSLTDILASIGIYFSVRISEKKADKDHPFGHRKAEVIAGLIVAIFTGIVGFEVIKNAISEYYNPEVLVEPTLALIIIIITLIVKSFMYFYFKKHGEKLNSPAILATSQDAKNDVLISILAIIGITAQIYGKFGHIDNAVAILLGVYIIYSGYRIGIENIDYLMGKAPAKEKIDEIKKIALSVHGVKGVNEIKAHYFGNYVHVELNIDVDKDMTTQKSHDLGKRVRDKVEEIDYVDHAFIHIDPK